MVEAPVLRPPPSHPRPNARRSDEQRGRPDRAPLGRCVVSVIILLSWMLSGIVLSVALARPAEPPWAGAPMAAFLGPFWLCVTLDQRTTGPGRVTTWGGS